MSTKQAASALSTTQNLLLSVICCSLFEFINTFSACGLPHPADNTGKAIHAFQIRHGGPLHGLKLLPSKSFFFFFLNSTAHPLG